MSKRIIVNNTPICDGQVLSRAFGSEDALGLAPLIDLLNHRQGAARPAAIAFRADKENAGEQGSDDDPQDVCVCVTSSQDGRPLALAQGDELCISYVGGRRNQAGRINALLNFGFVPSELM